MVTASDEALLARLDRQLWDQGAASFLPHGVAGGSDDSAQPVLLSQFTDAPNSARNILLAPPSYFKNVSDDGLFTWFSAVFAGLGSKARDIIVYNIPSVTMVKISVDLVARLRAVFPGIERLHPGDPSVAFPATHCRARSQSATRMVPPR